MFLLHNNEFGGECMKKVKKVLEDAVYIGLGAASITRKKADSFVRDLHKRGVIDAKDAENMLGNIMKKVDSETKESRDAIREAVHTIAAEIADKTKFRKTTKRKKKSKKKAKKSVKRKTKKKTAKRKKKR